MIQIDHVSKSYDGGKTFSVSDLSLEVRDGEIFGILGPNGAGTVSYTHLTLPTKLEV